MTLVGHVKGQPSLQPAQIEGILNGLRELLARHDNNQSATARELGITQAAVNAMLLRKTNPSYRTAERVASKLGIQVWQLIGAPAPPHPSARTHPQLWQALDLVGDRAPAEARDRILAAAATLPDFAQATWLAMLLDPAHATSAPASRVTPTRTQEVLITPKKPA